jgi:hypothetical protein
MYRHQRKALLASLLCALSLSALPAVAQNSTSFTFFGELRQAGQTSWAGPMSVRIANLSRGYDFMGKVGDTAPRTYSMQFLHFATPCILVGDSIAVTPIDVTNGIIFPTEIRVVSPYDITAGHLRSDLLAVVPVALLSSRVWYERGHAFVSWRLSEDGAPFRLLKRRNGSAESEEISSNAVEQLGNQWFLEDRDVTEGSSYRYILEVQDEQTFSYDLGSITIPRRELTLYQNAPNPFNPITRIRFDVAETSTVSLMIYNAAGHLVRTLEHSARLEQNAYTYEWDGRDDGGNRVGSGVYFYRLRAGKHAITRKMILLK